MKRKVEVLIVNQDLGTSEWKVIETTETNDRLLQHAHIADIKSDEVKEIEKVEDLEEVKSLDNRKSDK